MAKSAADRTIRDDPDQMFFSFVQPTAAAAHVNAAQPAVSSPPAISARTPRPPSFKATAAPLPSDVPSPAVALKPPQAYLTEARAAELFLAVASECRAGDVTRARVVFKPFRATLYSFKVRRNGLASVKFHVAFRQASETVLTQAARLMLTKVRARRALPRDAYDAFVRALPSSDFELPGARRSHRTSLLRPGRHHSLLESFKRVNAEYFKSRIEQPELCWSPARARRTLGSYQERADRVIISQMFDQPHVPPFVLDYLMYHELLHKFLGVGRRDSGKRLMHGQDFKRLEKRFRHFKEAQAFLKRL
jgi:predicted metal-dependent hydrolase